jgi:rhamnose utilization protein RhaD (predicted bifunctional aldolase and dehydrogenase)
MIKEKTSLKGHYKFTLKDIRTGKEEIFEYDNIIPTSGRTLIANNLTDATPDNNIRLNKAALGTGTSAPANGDTQLETETYRNDLASRTNADNIAYVTAFFNATEVTGTFREAGIFADGAAGANTGVLFSRVAINITKSNTQTLTLDWTLTIS